MKAALAPPDAPPDALPNAPESAAAVALAELFKAVEAAPSAFDFYALLRRVDSLRRHLPRTGEAQRPRQEALRLGQAAELDFAPAPLHALQRREGHSAPRLVVRFFGLLGPMGPLPLHFTEVVRDPSLALLGAPTAEQLQAARHDTTLLHFLDLFHHRTLSLFYRAWAQPQPVVHLDRPADYRFQVWFAALAGVPSPVEGALPPAAPVPRARSRVCARRSARWPIV